LVEAARAGDAGAWERLYRRIYPRLRAYVAARVDQSEVEDMVNETMTRAVAGVGKFRWEPSGFDAWIFGIARNVTVDHYRAAGRRRRVSLGEERSGAIPQPGDALQLTEEHAEVRAAFALLPKPDRELLELRVIAGLSAEDVARAMGKQEGAVRTAQSRALARLRVLLAGGQ
jgi:RNA polymerase sigma-70 factor (ECF subfamily)